MLTAEKLERLNRYDWELSHFVNPEGDEYVLTLSDIDADGYPDVFKEAYAATAEDCLDQLEYLCDSL